MKIPHALLFARRRAVPMIMTAESAECGLACLAMIGAFHGHEIDLNGLRQRFSLSLAGANIRDIANLADQMLLSSRALRVDLGALHRVQLPAILHWKLDHFVVLTAIDRKRAIIHDPSAGRLVLPLEKVSDFFTGVVLELTPIETFEPIVARVPVTLSSLWTKLRGLTASAMQVLLLSAALQIVTFAAPFQMQLVIDEALGRSDASLLAVIALGFGALVILQALIEAVRVWTLQLLGNQMVFQMVGHLVHHLMRLPSAYFEKRHVGDVISRLSSTKTIKDALTQGLVAALVDGGMAMLAAVVLLVYSPILALVVMVSMALLALANLAFYPVIRARTEELIRTVANEQTLLMETVRAITTIKLMGREAEREGVWRNAYAKTINASVSLGRFQISLAFVDNVIIGLQTVLVIYLGARAILHAQGFSVGMLMAFLSFRQTFSDRATSLVTQGLQFRLLGLHLERLGDIIAQEAEQTIGSSHTLDVAGAVAATEIAFQYGATDPWVFQNLSLSIEAGEFVAITGASGNGKTTLLKVLLGLQPPSRGRLVLDGHLATPAVWRTWRAQVGVVAQDDKLLSGTLADNIAFFDPDLNMPAVVKAAKAAQVHDDIMAKPMQYRSLVGDMGSTLSGGQYQRILLARALYRSPKVLILDEGTANLDEATEAAIADLVSQLPITRLVVSHRPALVLRAHRVLRMQDGALDDITDQWRDRKHELVKSAWA